MTSKEVQGHLIMENSLHIFGTQIEDQDQAQDEDEVQRLLEIFQQKENDLNKQKENDLKKDVRLLVKLSPSLGSINQDILSECQEWFFRERSLLPMCRGLPPFVDKLSVVLGRLTQKW